MVEKLEKNELSDVRKAIGIGIFERKPEDAIELSRVEKAFDEDCSPAFATQLKSFTDLGVKYLFKHVHSAFIVCKKRESGELLLIPGTFELVEHDEEVGHPAILTKFKWENLPPVEQKNYVVLLDEDRYLLVRKEIDIIMESLNGVEFMYSF